MQLKIPDDPKPKASMDLRKYQDEAVTVICKKFEEGVRKQVAVLATGLGKTVIFSHLIKDVVKAKGKKALVIAHRQELLGQAKDKIERVEPSLRVDIEQAENYADHIDADVIVASTATLGRGESQRLQRFNPKEFGLIVIDEAHHASATSYKNILRYFGVLKSEPEADWNKDILLLGVTATPSRNDNQGIDQIFDQVTYDFGIVDGMKKGWLSRIKALRVSTGTDISNVGKTAGDFNIGQLEEVINTEKRNKLIVKTYKDLVPGQQALCFAVDVAHTQELCREFIAQGVKASYVIGDTDTIVRKTRLQEFYNKEINVMVNAMVLTEGYDNEHIQTILMARPTQSGILYQQMIGRGTRIASGKSHLTLIDFVDNTYKQRLQTSASLLGIAGAVDFKGKDILDVSDSLTQLLELAPDVDLSKVDIDHIDRMIEEVDILSGLEIPNEVSQFTDYEWYRFSDEAYRINLGDHGGEKLYMMVTETMTGQFQVAGTRFNTLTKEETNKDLFLATSLEAAIHYADGIISQYYPDSLKLIDSSAKWRKQDPSDNQLTLLRKMRVNEAVITHLDKGKASRLITKLVNMKPKQRSGFVRPSFL